MSFFGRTREELEQLSRHFSVEALCVGKTDDFITEALCASGRAIQRKSPLQPKLVMWLVLSLPIFRADSIPAILARLLTGVRDRLLGLPLRPVGDDAISHARTRLGVEPLRRFFQSQAAEIRPAASFHGLRVWSVDGTKLTMPDTEPNRRAFGKPGSSRGQSAFPQMAMLGLQDAHTRRLRDVQCGPCRSSERRMLLPMLGHMGAEDLILMDRGFYGVWLFEEICNHKAHFLCRAPAGAKLRAVRGTRKQTGCYLAWIEARVPLPEGETVKGKVGRPARTRKVRLLVRVIEYRLRGHESVRLVTSLLDTSIEARDLAIEYHRRWEIELGFDEIKTHQSSTAAGTCKTIFRGLSPRSVMQEAYALVASYNLIRATIAEAATGHQLDPDEISFVDSLRAIEHMIPRMAAAGAKRLAALHEELLQDIADARLTRRRRPRCWPRVVKVKMSNYKAKRGHHRESYQDFERDVRMGA